MANAAPATVTITSTTGPGQTVTSLKYTDVNDIEVDFLRNVVWLTRAGAGGKLSFDYSALGASITWSVAGGAGGGATTVVLS
jgi:hypothetical protein